MSRYPSYVENLMVNEDYWRDKGEEFQIERYQPSRASLRRERQAYDEAEYGIEDEFIRD